MSDCVVTESVLINFLNKNELWILVKSTTRSIKISIIYKKYIGGTGLDICEGAQEKGPMWL